MEEPIERKRVAGYIRVSTEEQAEEGYSLDAQRENILRFCDQHHYELVDVYADEGISGKTIEKRPGIKCLMADASKNKFDLVVVWKLTRLGRSIKNVLGIAELLFANNVEFRSISENFDISTSTGRLMFQMLGVFGEFERNQISENVSMAMTSLVKHKKRFAGGRMLGYVSAVDENGVKILQVEPNEAEIVRLIFGQYLQGKGYRAIANFLNKQGYQTVKGNSFTTIAVKGILMNPTYAGYLRYGKYINWEEKRRKGLNPHPIQVEGSHEPIIEKEVYHHIQEKLKVNHAQPKWTHSGENVLTGLLKCPECGAPMAASNTTNTLKDGTKKRMRYYSCSVFRSKGSSICHANSIRAEVAEAFVEERLKEVVLLPAHLKEIIKGLNKELKEQRAPLELEQKVVQQQEQDIQAKITKWKSLIEDTPELAKELEARMKELEIELAVTRQRRQTIASFLEKEGVQLNPAEVEKMLHYVNALLAGRNKKDIKAIYRTFIESITFNKETKGDIQIRMLFDAPIINQLNQVYQAGGTSQVGVSPVSLSFPIQITI